jgi:hypothetical protein
MQTTLNKIQQHSPCEYGWKRLLKSLDKTQADDEPIEFRRIVDTQRFSDAVWYLRTVDGIELSIISFISFCQTQCIELGVAVEEMEEYDLSDRSMTNLLDIADEAIFDTSSLISRTLIKENLFYNSAGYDRAIFKMDTMVERERIDKFIELFC